MKHGLGYFIIELDGKKYLLCSDATSMLKEYKYINITRCCIIFPTQRKTMSSIIRKFNVEYFIYICMNKMECTKILVFTSCSLLIFLKKI